MAAGPWNRQRRRGPRDRTRGPAGGVGKGDRGCLSCLQAPLLLPPGSLPGLPRQGGPFPARELALVPMSGPGFPAGTCPRQPGLPGGQPHTRGPPSASWGSLQRLVPGATGKAAPPPNTQGSRVPPRYSPEKATAYRIMAPLRPLPLGLHLPPNVCAGGSGGPAPQSTSLLPASQASERGTLAPREARSGGRRPGGVRRPALPGPQADGSGAGGGRRGLGREPAAPPSQYLLPHHGDGHRLEDLGLLVRGVQGHPGRPEAALEADEDHSLCRGARRHVSRRRIGGRTHGPAPLPALPRPPCPPRRRPRQSV